MIILDSIPGRWEHSRWSSLRSILAATNPGLKREREHDQSASSLPAQYLGLMSHVLEAGLSRKRVRRAIGYAVSFGELFVHDPKAFVQVVPPVCQHRIWRSVMTAQQLARVLRENFQNSGFVLLLKSSRILCNSKRSSLQDRMLLSCHGDIFDVLRAYSVQAQIHQGPAPFQGSALGRDGSRGSVPAVVAVHPLVACVRKPGMDLPFKVRSA